MGGDTASVALVIIIVIWRAILLSLLLIVAIEEGKTREGRRHRRGHRSHRFKSWETAAIKSSSSVTGLPGVVFSVGRRGQGDNEEEE